MSEQANAAVSGRTSFVRWLVGGMVSALMLLALGLAWYGFNQQQQYRLSHHFQAETQRFTTTILWRMQAHIQILRAAAGLFATSDHVSREEWQRYIQAQELDQTYPGIQGVGFSQWIQPEQLGVHIQEMRRLGFSNYQVRPVGERTAYSSIVYLEPFIGRNLRAFGYDMFSEPVRRAAMERARDTGTAALSGKVTLVQETSTDVQAGVLVYLPVYAKDTQALSVEQRRTALRGWVYSPYRMYDLIESISSLDLSGMRLEIYDGVGTNSQALLFDSQRLAQTVPPAAFVSTVQMDIAGHQWTLRYSALPGFVAVTKFNPAWVEISTIVIIAMLLLGLAWALINTQYRANAIATRLTHSLREEEARFRATFEHADVGIAQIDLASGRFLHVNHDLCQLTGYSRNELEQMTFHSLTHPDDMQLGHAELRALAQGDIDHYTIEKRYLHRSGRTLWCAFSISVVRVTDSQQTYSIAVFKDETKHRQAQHALRASEERFRSFIENANDIILSLDAKGLITYVSPVVTTALGYQPSVLIGTSVAKLVHEQDIAACQEFLRHALASTVKQDPVECRIRHTNGSWRWYSTTGTVLRGVDDAMPSFLGIARDISDMRQIREALERAVHAAEAANQAKTHFLATTSHEIRTPMNSILGLAQLLMSATISNVQRQDYARTIFDSGQSLLNLLNDILDLSKVEAGKLTLDSVAFDPVQILYTTEALFAEAAHKKNLKLTVQWLGETGSWFLGDPLRLQQMLGNLVSNAIRYTTHGAVQIEARELGRKGGVAVLEFAVQDTGIGIPADKLDQLYQPFSQLDRAPRLGSTGLGLSIVHSLAYLMGGEVGVQSEVGRGSRFWFKIRAGVTDKDDATLRLERAPMPVPPFSALPAKLSGRVLVVEDNPINRKVVASMLASMGLEVQEAENGQLGVDAVVAQQQAIDLVLMDIEMPVLDGYAATEQIRRWEREHGQMRLPIIALTANVFDEHRRLCLVSGMDDFCAKPIDLELLRVQLARWLPAKAVSVAPSTEEEIMRSVDTARVEALLAELLPMLQQSRFNAIAKFRELQDAVAGTIFATAIDKAGEPLAQLQFGVVHDRLQALAKVHNWKSV